MSDVLVLIPAAESGNLPQIDGAVLVPYTTTLDVVVSLKGSDLAAVVCTDGIADEEAESVATAIRERAAPCVEVRLGPWDGESHSPVSAVCRGVISGFGVAGVVRAVELLSK
jgi:3-dehydroquinate dehydratase